MNDNELSINIQTASTKAENGLDSVVTKINLVKAGLNKTIPAFNSINRLSTGLKNLNKLDMANLKNQFTQLSNAIEPFTSKLEKNKKMLADFSKAIDLSKISTQIQAPKIDSGRQLAINTSKLDQANIKTNILNEKLEQIKQKSKTAIQLDYVKVQKANIQLEKSKSQLEKIQKTANKGSSSMKQMFDLGKLYLFWNYTARIRDGIINMMQSSINFIETQNLFAVSMGKYTGEATKFMNKMAEAFGLARGELMRYQATFNNIMKSLPGLADETSYALSETLLIMATDYASLFNFTLPTALEKFNSALVGSVKPIRDSTGLDITEQTLSGEAQKLGIETSIRQMSQMEKRLLRIISLQEQMGEIGAMGDFARTIESPSNQLKILSQQIQELGVWLGNTFIGVIGEILPYINGFVMALVGVIKTLAVFLGYQNTTGSTKDPLQTEDMTTGFDNVGSSIGGATDKAKEFKKSLQGFDVLNNISLPDTSSGGGAGGGSPTGIDPAILGALKDYDSLMADVSMKATKIRDDIMEWLGFTKIVNTETGEITWRLNEGYTNLEKIIDVVKVIGVFLAGWGVLKILNTIAKIYLAFKSSSAIIGTFSKMFPALATVLSPIVVFFKNIQFAISAIVAGAATFGEAFALVFPTIAKIFATIVGIAKAIAAAIGITTGALVAIVAAVVAAIALIIINWEAVSKFFIDSWNLIKEVWNQVYTWFETNLLIPLSEKFNEVWTNIVSLWENLANWFNNNVIQPVLSVFIPLSTKIIEIFTTIWKIIEAVFGYAFSWINETFIQPFVTNMVNLVNTIIKILNDIKNNVVTIFITIKNFIYNNMIIPISNFFINVWDKMISTLGGIANWIYWNVVVPVKNFFNDIFVAIGDLLSSIIKGTINGALTKVEDFVNGFINGLNKVVSIINAIPNVEISYVSKLSLPRMYESGGLPPIGELFIAREKGPELVGKMGSSNAVANNQQITEGIRQAVLSAMTTALGSGSMQSDINLYVDGDRTETKITQRQNRNKMIYGV